MSKGVIYLMSTGIPGLTLIDNARISDYIAEIEKHESSEIFGVSDFTLIFSILVEGYTQKCAMVRNLFLHRRLSGTNLYAVEGESVFQLLSAFKGDQLFPPLPPEEDIVGVLRNSIKTADTALKVNWGKVPPGTYFLSENRRLLGHIEASMYVEKGMFVVKKGSQCFPAIGLPLKCREKADIDGGVLQNDVICRSPTAAATLVMGKKTNGWFAWKNINDIPINVYRSETREEHAEKVESLMV